MGSKKPAPAPQPALSGQLKRVQADNLAALNLQSAGKGPSVSAQALQAAKQRSLASQVAAAQSARTSNVGALQRQLVAERGAAEREVAQGTKLGRVQEQQAAQKDILTMTEGSLNRQAQMNALEAQRQQQAAAGKNQMAGQVLGAVGTVVGGIYGGPAGAAAGGAVGTGVGQAMSDKRAKENAQPASKQLKSFLDELSSRQKPKSEVAKSMKDPQSSFGAILAAQAELNKRINKLEKE